MNTTPRQRYAAGQTLRDVLRNVPVLDSEKDRRIRGALGRAARALERGRDPLDAAAQEYRTR
jgi:hypothetical protein